MELLEKRLIMNLKSQFFEIITQVDSLFKYESIIEQMLLVIKQLLYVDNVSLYTYNEEEQLMPVAITNESDIAVDVPPDVYNDLLKGAVTLPFHLEYMNNNCLIIPIKANDLYFLFLKGKSKNISELSESTIKQIGSECELFIRKAQQLVKSSLEEKRYKQLFRVTEKVHSTMNMEHVLGEIIVALQEIYPTFTYYLYLSQDYKGFEGLPIKALDYDDTNYAIMQAYLSGTIQLEDTLSTKQSILYAPLKGKQGVYGVLQVIAPNTKQFPQNEVEFISVLANTAGTAMENTRLYEQSRRLIADLQLINETSHRLNSNLRLTETMEYMSNQIAKSLGAEEVGFIQYTSDDELVHNLPGTTAFFFDKQAEKYIEYFKEKIKKENEALFIGDLKPPFNQNPPYIFKSVMAVPMVQSDVLHGLVLVLHRQPYAFSFETFKLFRSLIHHSTLAFTNTILREELEKMVITDHLTKLYSRNYLDEKIQQSMVEDGEGTFIIIDIDDFKQINDTYGHQVGDEVIIQVANIIQSNIRGSDIGARWGGEELAIYLPKMPVETGVQIAERLVDKVRELSKPTVTISCGISYWKKEESDCYNTLFKRADKALYAAKGSGKNKVVVQPNTD